MFGQMALQIFLIIKWSGTFPTLVHAVFLFLFSDVGPLQMPEKFLVISSKILGTFVTNQFSLVNLQGMDSQGSFSSKCFGAFITNPSWGWTTIISSQMSSHFNQWSTSKGTNVQISRLHSFFWEKFEKLSILVELLAETSKNYHAIWPNFENHHILHKLSISV